MQYSTAVRNAKLDAVEATIGASAVMKIWSGSKPANCAAADTGTLLAEVALPADWMAAAVDGVKAMSGSWTVGAALDTGVAGHFRVYNSGGVVCGIQGTVGVPPGGFDMLVDSTSFNAGQPFTVTGFTIIDNNG